MIAKKVNMDKALASSRFYEASKPTSFKRESSKYGVLVRLHLSYEDNLKKQIELQGSGKP